MMTGLFLRFQALCLGVGLVVGVGAAPAVAQGAAAPAPAVREFEDDDDGGFEPETSPADDAAVAEAGPPASEDEDAEEEEGGFEDATSDQTLVSGRRGARKRIAGSATVIGEKDLEAMKYDDIQRVLKQKAPGVYVRDEDGFGLRPNIGLRGANSDRSAKITLLEDNILFGPAPYAAPAAYYFPLMTRMVGVEVFKGPAALRTGPNTVGGAINLRTRRIPWSGVHGGIDVAGGMYESAKGGAWLGAGTDHFGIVVEGAHLRSGGFKRIDGGGGNGLFGNDTGFSRNDVMLKARANTDPTRNWMHLLEVKLGFGNEDSQETYLGLTDADFEKDPFRRYLASSRGHMQWDRTSAQARYRFTWGNDVDVSVTAYRHDLHRAWEKFNRLRNGPDVRRVLQNPTAGTNALFYQLLTGERDSEDENEALMIGTNDRRYFAQGIQSRGRFGFSLGPIRQDIEVGVRLHQDQIQRHHSENGFLTKGGTLVRDSRDTLVTADNTGTAVAGSAFVVDEISWGPVLLAPGVRVEAIRTTFEDRLPEDGLLTDNFRVAVVPGIGAYVQALPVLGIFGGVHKGFAPVGPGQPADVLPEESWNYELGTRLTWQKTNIEAVGFVNHYTNLTGACTFSAGCDDSELNAQFNAGEALVGGAEVVAAQSINLPWDITLAADGTYTLTVAQFLTEFTSGFPQWGDVKVGDELPYVPSHQASLTGTFERKEFRWTASLSYVAPMRDEAGQGEIDPALATQHAFVVDTLASYALFPNGSLYFRVDNLFNAKTIAARRPYGARPSKPMLVMVGFKQSF